MTTNLKFNVHSVFSMTDEDGQSDPITAYGLFKLGKVTARDYFLKALSHLVYDTIGSCIEDVDKDWIIVCGGSPEIAEHFSLALAERLKDKQVLPIAAVKKNIDPQEDYSSSSFSKRKQIAHHLFECATRFDGKHIIAIDDMVVTGTVMEQLLQAVIESGGDPHVFHFFTLIRASLAAPQDEGQILADCFSRLTVLDVADMMNDPSYRIPSGMMKMLARAQHIDIIELATRLWPSRKRLIKSDILDYYAGYPVPEQLRLFLGQCINSNSLECDIRKLLLHVPNIPERLVKMASYGVSKHHFLGMLEQHSVMRMIPDQHIELPEFSYQDAGQQDWRPLRVDTFRQRTWYQERIAQPWFGERLLLLEKRGNTLRDLVHPEISRMIGSPQYAFAIYGAFLFREKPKGNDLDAIVINNSSNLQVFGSQEMEIPGLSDLLPHLAQDKLDLNIVSLEALRNSRSETSMSMFCTLGHALFLVGEELPPVPPYLYLFKLKAMWSRQTWTFLDEPLAFVPPKMVARVEAARALIHTVLRLTSIEINPVDADLLSNESRFRPGEYETVAEYFPRITTLLGHFIDLIDGSMKRMIRDSLLHIYPSLQDSATPLKIRLNHITPDFNQICGISKYSMALHQSLSQLPSVSAAHIGISEDNTTKDPGSFSQALQRAVEGDPDIVHIHFADGLLRKNHSEGFLEFAQEHAQILAQARVVVATLYELGPRMLSANRLPQNILADTTPAQRALLRDDIRRQIMRLLGVVKGVIVHSEEQRAFLYNDPHFSESVLKNHIQVQVMRHGIPAPSQEYEDPQRRTHLRSVIRERLGISQGQFVLIQFGFIRSNKYGVDMVRLLERNQDFVWLLAGGLRQDSHHVYQDWLLAQADERGVGKRVVVTGTLKDEEISPVFAAADVAVIPYKTGTDSYSLATCLGHSLPVIGSGLPFVKGYRRRYGDVVYAAIDDSRFEQQARYLADHPNYRAALCQATSFARIHDSWQQIAWQTHSFYSGLLPRIG